MCGGPLPESSEKERVKIETLIFNGSPRPDGDTVSLLRALKPHLTGDVMQIDAYTCGISPCVDCRYCWEHESCAYKDGWEQVDRLLRRCDSILIATPIYFSQPTGPLLSLLSRTQQYFCSRVFRRTSPGLSAKRGGILLVGGGDGAAKPAAETLKTLLRLMGCRETAPAVCCHHTNEFPALQEPGVEEQLKALAAFLEARR